MSGPATKDGISVRRIGGHRHLLRITATRGAVTTEAVLTEAEAVELHRKLGKILAAPVSRVGQTGEQSQSKSGSEEGQDDGA